MTKITITPNASGTGTFTIAAPNSSNSRTFTLPDETGTVLTSVSNLDATKLTGNIDATNLTGNLPAISGAALTNLPAPTTSQVLDATANASVGAVGSYAFLYQRVGAGTDRSPGFTLAGSSLDYSSASGDGATSPSGTWRLMGQLVPGGSSGSSQNSSVWLRIS